MSERGGVDLGVEVNKLGGRRSDHGACRVARLVLDALEGENGL